MANIGRNDPCPCGSGKKFKKCCLLSQELQLMEKCTQERIEDVELQKWFENDLATGSKNLAEYEKGQIVSNCS